MLNNELYEAVSMKVVSFFWSLRGVGGGLEKWAMKMSGGGRSSARAESGVMLSVV